MKYTLLIFGALLFAQLASATSATKHDQAIWDFANEYYAQSTVMQSYAHLQALLSTADEEARMVKTDPDGDAGRMAEIEHYQALQTVYLAHPDHQLKTFEEAQAIFNAVAKSCALNAPGEILSPLNDFERTAICLYTKSEYVRILPAMERGSATFAHIISYIDSALEKLPQVHESVIRYSQMPEASIQALKPGSIFIHKAFTSTSRGGAKYLAPISNVEMHILVKHGADISKYSFNSVEKEVLLPRNSKLKVASLVRRTDGKWLISLEQL